MLAEFYDRTIAVTLLSYDGCSSWDLSRLQQLTFTALNSSELVLKQLDSED